MEGQASLLEIADRDIESKNDKLKNKVSLSSSRREKVSSNYCIFCTFLSVYIRSGASSCEEEITANGSLS